MEEVDLSNTNLREQQVKAIFLSISNESKLKKLNLRGILLDKLEPSVLCAALRNVEKADLPDLTNEQLVALFKDERGTQNLKLILTGQDFLDVGICLISSALSKIEEVNLCGSELTREQLGSIFSAIIRGESRIKKLNLRGQKLCTVDPSNSFIRILSEAVSMLDAVDMSGVGLSADEWVAVFHGLCGEAKLRFLDVSGNDLHQVDPHILAASLSRLERLSIRRAKITKVQAEAWFTRMRDGSKLKELDIRGTDLSSVDAALLGDAINMIDEVIMKSSRLSDEQIEGIFRTFGKDSKIKKLNIKYNGSDNQYNRKLSEWADELEWNNELKVGMSVRYGWDSNYPGSDEHDFSQDEHRFFT